MAEGCLVCGRRGAQGQRPSLFNDFSVLGSAWCSRILMAGQSLLVPLLS